jgi:hypothetical protein
LFYNPDTKKRLVSNAAIFDEKYFPGARSTDSWPTTTPAHLLGSSSVSSDVPAPVLGGDEHPPPLFDAPEAPQPGGVLEPPPVPHSALPLVKPKPLSPPVSPTRPKTPPTPSSASDATPSVQDTHNRSVAPSPEPASPVSAPSTAPLALRREPRTRRPPQPYWIAPMRSPAPEPYREPAVESDASDDSAAESSEDEFVVICDGSVPVVISLNSAFLLPIHPSLWSVMVSYGLCPPSIFPYVLCPLPIAFFDSVVGRADVLDGAGKPREQAKEDEIEVCRDIILHIPREQAKEDEIEV